jgi:hypothetical protein
MSTVNGLPFDKIYQIISAMNALQPKKCGNCGFTPEEITTSQNAEFPDSTLTLEEIQDLLTSGIKKGVFKLSQALPDDDLRYSVNSEMIISNVKNTPFVTKQPGYKATPYLSCDSDFYGTQQPYSRANGLGGTCDVRRVN